MGRVGSEAKWGEGRAFQEEEIVYLKRVRQGGAWYVDVRPPGQECTE